MTLEIKSGVVYRGKLLEGSFCVSPFFFFFSFHLLAGVLFLCGRRSVLFLATGKKSSSSSSFFFFFLLTLFLFFASIAEDSMNIQLKDITVTARDGRVSHLDQVYIRGSHVRFFIVPDMLRYVDSRRIYIGFLLIFYLFSYLRITAF